MNCIKIVVFCQKRGNKYEKSRIKKGGDEREGIVDRTIQEIERNKGDKRKN